ELPLPRIPGYEILEVLGEGGMGIVYKAKTKANNVVALKMVLAGPRATADEIQRFVRNIALHASLDHAHVIPIFHVDEYEGRPYFTMKLVEAGTLKSRLARFQLVPKDGKAGKIGSRTMIMQRA